MVTNTKGKKLLLTMQSLIIDYVVVSKKFNSTTTAPVALLLYTILMTITKMYLQ